MIAITTSFLDSLRKITGENFVFTKEEDLQNYSHDQTEDLRFWPQVVVKPGTAKEVAAILALCNRDGIPVTPAGARTGLSGGMLPILGGVILATERMNKILEIDEKNLQAVVEPAVITQVFQEAVEEKGLMYPVDPASRGSCFIGGNLAECSGGMRAVKYGITKDWVLDLEVALPTGEIIHTGARTLKNSTGYNLTQLLIGSEGTLGVITKAVFRLIPKPTQRRLMIAPFKNAEKACEAVSAIFHHKITPSALEFLEIEAWNIGRKFSQTPEFLFSEAEAILLIEVDGNYPEILMQECETIYSVLEGFDCGEILFAESEEEQSRIWKVRRVIGEAVKSHNIYKEEDTVVPRAELARLWKFVKQTQIKYGFHAICYGHAGDGNLHVNILKSGLNDDAWENELPKAIREIFVFTKTLGGTLSGEHGIGWVQRNYMDIVFSDTELALMKGIKKVFDPNGILNPGKIFPDD